VSEQRVSPTTGTVAPLDEGQGRSQSVLEEEREFFLRSLRDLEAERAAGDIDEVDYLALRDDYTVRAAHVLRQLAFLAGRGPDPDAGRSPDVTGASLSGPGVVPPESGTVRPDGAAGSGEVAPPPRPWLKRVLTGVAIVLIVGGAAWAASAAAGVRLPGEGVSGSNTLDQATQLVINAETAEADNNPAQALKDYQGALAKDPTNAEALTGEGAILVEAGGSGGEHALVDEGITELGKAEIADPAYAAAYAYRGLGYYYEGNFKAAVPQFEIYVADTPARSRIKSVSTLLAKAKAKVANAS
jgi:hypothetical protein